MSLFRKPQHDDAMDETVAAHVLYPPRSARAAGSSNAILWVAPERPPEDWSRELAEIGAHAGGGSDE